MREQRYPISGYTGFPQNFTAGGWSVSPNGHQTFIGVFPKWTPPASQTGSGAYPGLR